ncbi:hypothetical protein AA103196_2038 [Ameyamaea chiangmaiensis NBRC 103196]|nr:hypothetical protein AA103196_2038 [Ameyamaea chiangmaiensis NBRC 103196]
MSLADGCIGAEAAAGAVMPVPAAVVGAVFSEVPVVIAAGCGGGVMLARASARLLSFNASVWLACADGMADLS